MQFTGKNLELVEAALSLAEDEVHNRIATCPDVNRYAEEIAELEAQKLTLQKLRLKVEKSLNAERARK